MEKLLKDRSTQTKNQCGDRGSPLGELNPPFLIAKIIFLV